MRSTVDGTPRHGQERERETRDARRGTQKEIREPGTRYAKGEMGKRYAEREAQNGERGTASEKRREKTENAKTRKQKMGKARTRDRLFGSSPPPLNPLRVGYLDLGVDCGTTARLLGYWSTGLAIHTRQRYRPRRRRCSGDFVPGSSNAERERERNGDEPKGGKRRKRKRNEKEETEEEERGERKGDGKRETGTYHLCIDTHCNLAEK